MLKKAVTISVIFWAYSASSLLQAQALQNVFAVPGANSTSGNILVYSANPFSNITGFTAGPGTFTVLAKPDGSKFYAIANSGSQTVTVVPNNFTNPRSLANLGTQATAAAISEDGKRLAVAAGLLHIFDTAGDSDIVPNGISIGPSVNVFDVAASLDGKTFYALGSNSAGGSVLAAVDASSTVVTGTLPISGPTVAVAVGPNGLIYVSAPNQVLEVNPTTLTATTGGSILVNARPGKLVFTPDGMNALAVNQTPATGSAVLLFGLSSHAVANSVPAFGVTLNQLQVLNSTNVLAYSNQNQSLYQITLSSNGNLSINGFTLPGIGTSNVIGFVLSNEVPAGGRSFPQYLFAAVSGTLYREDLTTSNISGQFALSTTPGALSYAGGAFTGTPASLLQYGNNQTIAPNGVSLPVVVRVLDNLGNPLSGVTVNFASTNPSASMSPASATTGSSGYAVTYVTAPSTTGPLSVSASAGSQTALFTLSVGTGGGGTNSGALKIIAGQGQILYTNTNTGIAGFGSPLIVEVDDTNGKPVAGASVRYAVSQGQGGSVIAPGSQLQPDGSYILTTDNNGQTSANFLSAATVQTGYTQTTVTVSAANAGSVNFYMTTIPAGSPAQVQLKAPSVGATISGQAGATLPGAVSVLVTTVSGLAIPNASVRLTLPGPSANPQDPTQPGAQCNDPTGAGILTGADGIATCDLVLNGHIGTASLAANAGYSQSTPGFLVQISAGPPGILKIVQGNNQTGNPGQKLPLALLVQVTDAFGNVLSGIPVTWSVVNPGTVSLSNVINVTDSNGNASALATLGNVAGNAQVKVVAGNISATFTLTVTIPSAGIQKISGDNQTTLIRTAFPSPLVVEVVDSKGNGVAGVQVTFAIVAGSGSVVTPSAITGANGQASTNVNAGANAGTILVNATSSTFTVTFTLTSRLPGPSNVNFSNAASFQPGIAPGSIAIISGNGIAPGVQGLVTAYNILGQPQPSLAGISITFNGVTAPIYYVLTATGQPDQVAVQVPFETQPGTASVVINAAGGGSGTISTQIQPFAPGIFETNSGGQKYAVALRPDGSYVTPSNPAHPGETILVYLTGLGQVTPATATGSAGVAGQTVGATLVTGLNNGGVPYISAQYAQGMVGVYVIALQIPPDAQTGPAQPIAVVAYDAANNAYFSQGSLIAIQ